MKDKRHQEIQISYFNELTMLGKKYLMDIMSSASILRLNEHKQVELTQQQREEYYNKIFVSIEHYREVIDKNLVLMQRIITESDEQDNSK